MPLNRLLRYLSTSEGRTSRPKGTVPTSRPEVDGGFMLVPANLFGAAGVENADLYERALESARRQAARPPRNRLARFWNRGCDS